MSTASCLPSPASSSTALRPFRSGLSPEAVDRALRDAVSAQARAERAVALWFTEVVRRRLHKPLGFGTPFLYATEGLCFSSSKAYQLLRIADAMREHPALRQAIERRELPWTKAREILPVVTQQSAGRWVVRARQLSRKELVATVAAARTGDRGTRREDPAQATLGAGVSGRASGIGGELESAGADASSSATADTGANTTARESARTDPMGAAVFAPAVAAVPPPTDACLSAHTERVPHTMSLRLDPLALARLEGLLSALERAGVRGTREELVVGGLEALLAASEAARAEQRAPAAFIPHRHTRSPYQVTLRVCPSCRRGDVATSRGHLPLTHEELITKLVDADYVAPDLRRRASIPPRTRRAVLERDNHTCRAPGCTRRHGLDVHHGDCVAAGGANELDNYVTYCDRCHPAMHALADRKRASARSRGG